MSASDKQHMNVIEQESNPGTRGVSQAPKPPISLVQYNAGTSCFSMVWSVNHKLIVYGFSFFGDNKYVTCNLLAVWVSSVWYRIGYYMNLTSRGYVLVKFGQVISLLTKSFGRSESKSGLYFIGFCAQFCSMCLNETTTL